MTCPLAIYAPRLGTPSETFVRRHVADLLPGRTAVLAGSVLPPSEATWQFNGPLLALDRIGYPGGIRRIALGFRRRLGFGVSRERERAIRRFLERHQVRVVMGQFLDSSLEILRIVRGGNLPFWAHAHGYDVSAALRDPVMCQAYQDYGSAEGIITMSEVSRQRLLGLGLPAQKVHVVSYGVDVPDEPPPARSTRGEVRCLAVGRMVPKKAPILLLDAFRRASECVPGLTLDYVGAGELLPAAQQFVHAFDLGKRARLHGGLPHHKIKRLGENADIFIQHSAVDPTTGDEEGLPVAILEAMALSLPVVSTRHAGIPEAVLDGQTGYLVEEGASSSMGERISALAQNPDLRWRLGLAGWQRARERFTWQRERETLLSLLQPE